MSKLIQRTKAVDKSVVYFTLGFQIRLFSQNLRKWNITNKAFPERSSKIALYALFVR